MNYPAAPAPRALQLEAALVLMVGLAIGISLAVAVYLPTKWMVFILFMIVVMAFFCIVRQREKLLLYLSVALTSVFLSFHPIFLEPAAFSWPVSGFRISIFEVAFFCLMISWLIRLAVDIRLKVRLFPWVSIPFLLIWCLSLAGLNSVSMPGIVKFSNLWLIFESWLIFLFFANNIRDRRTVFNIVAVLLLAGVVQSILGLAQYVSGGSLGLQIFGESKSYNVYSLMMAGTEVISRVSGTFGHPNSLAGYLVMLVLINLSLFWAPISAKSEAGALADLIIDEYRPDPDFFPGGVVSPGPCRYVLLVSLFFSLDQTSGPLLPSLPGPADHLFYCFSGLNHPVEATLVSGGLRGRPGPDSPSRGGPEYYRPSPLVGNRTG